MAYFRRDDLLGPIQDFDAERNYIDRRLSYASKTDSGYLKKYMEDRERELSLIANSTRTHHILIKDEPIIMPKYRGDILPINDKQIIMPKYHGDIIL